MNVEEERVEVKSAPKPHMTRMQFLELAAAGTITTLILSACGRGIPQVLPTALPEAPDPIFEKKDSRVGTENVLFNSDGRMCVLNRQTGNYEPFFMRQIHGSVQANQGTREGWLNAKEMGANVVTMIFLDDNNMNLIREAGLKATVQFEYLFPDLKYNAQVLQDFMAKHGDLVVGFSLDEPSTDRPTPGWEPENIKRLLNDFTQDCSLPVNIFTWQAGTPTEIASRESRYILDLVNIIERNNSVCRLFPDAYNSIDVEIENIEKTLRLLPTGVLQGVVLPAFSEYPTLELDVVKQLPHLLAYSLANSRIYGFSLYDSPFGTKEWSYEGEVIDGQTNAFGRTRSVITSIVGELAKSDDINQFPNDLMLKKGLVGSIRGETICLFNKGDSVTKKFTLQENKKYKDIISGEIFEGTTEMVFKPYEGKILVPIS